MKIIHSHLTRGRACVTAQDDQGYQSRIYVVADTHGFLLVKGSAGSFYYAKEETGLIDPEGWTKAREFGGRKCGCPLCLDSGHQERLSPDRAADEHWHDGRLWIPGS